MLDWLCFVSLTNFETIWQFSIINLVVYCNLTVILGQTVDIERMCGAVDWYVSWHIWQAGITRSKPVHRGQSMSADR